MSSPVATLVLLGGVGLIAWGAEAFAEHLGSAAVALRVSTFALAVLLAGAEPEALATGVIGSLRHLPAVAYGDVIGANVAMCLAAFGIGAVLAPVIFTKTGLRYGLLALPAGILCAALAWSGHVGRRDGAVLVVAYLVYVGVIWKLEGRPPAIGEASELEEAREKTARQPTDTPRRAGPDLAIVLGSVVAMAGGGWALVTGLEHLTHATSAQTALSLTLVELRHRVRTRRTRHLRRPTRKERHPRGAIVAYRASDGDERCVADLGRKLVERAETLGGDPDLIRHEAAVQAGGNGSSSPRAWPTRYALNR